MSRSASACLALIALAGFVSAARADFRHYSSRLLHAGGNESLGNFAPGPDGDLFLEISIDSVGALGGVVGPGRVLAKLDANARLLWARPLFLLQPLYVLLSAMAATGDDGVVLAGGFSGTADFGLGPMTALGDDVFVVKVGPDGAVQWQKRFGGNQWQRANALAVDHNDDIVITGSNSLTIDFGGGIIRSNGGSDVFVAKLDRDGGHIWSRGFGRSGGQEGRSLVIGSDNRIAMAVRFDGGAIDFGDSLFISYGGDDVAAAVLDSNGDPIWSMRAGTPLSEGAVDMALDAHGNAFLCGDFSRPLDLGGGSLPIPPGVPGAGFVASYDSLGGYRWSYLVPDTVNSITIFLSADDTGNCFVLGRNWGPITFGLDHISPSRTFLLAFDSVGGPLAARGVDVAAHMRIDRPRDRIILGATLNGSIDFGGGTLQSQGSDVALAELGLWRPPKVTITDFGARVVDAGVELTWQITADEPVTVYLLSRRIDGSSTAQLLHTADAGEGDFSYLDATAKPGRGYGYRLTVVTALGDELYSDWTSVTTPSVVTTLEQNAPNPFNPRTTFAYSLAAPADVSVVIYTPAGEAIARLEQGMQPAGRHTASWGGHNMQGEFVASGVYFYRLEGEGVPDIGARKMLLLK